MKKKPSSNNTPSLPLVGRGDEERRIQVCLDAERHVLLEGPVGVGKTHLVLSILEKLGKKTYRIDGDGRYSEQKLTGWFDPPTVLKKGFVQDAFVPGPLVEAMQTGSILFINELNRLPEGVQNVLLPALDEKKITLPRLKPVTAKPGFQVIATQNPREFVATSHLSEAILDRFEWIKMDYQSELEEIEIVLSHAPKHAEGQLVAERAVRLVRLTRVHPRIKRGASVRAAMAIADLTIGFLKRRVTFRDAFLDAVMLALPNRIELDRAADSSQDAASELRSVIAGLIESVENGVSVDEKKK